MTLKTLFTVIGAILCTTLSFSQAAEHGHAHNAPENPEFCGINHQMEKLYEENPALEQQMNAEQSQFQIDYENFMQAWSPDDRVAYVIPVVVHVVHLGGSENISNAQIYDGIQQMNDDFSMTNSDNGNTISAFQGVIGNADIQFKLATKDPNGNCHSGITRTYSNTTYDTGISFQNGNHPIVDAVSAQHGIWQQQKYLNIFVCIDPDGAAGYTLKPSTFIPATSMYGGIIVRDDYFGTIGTSNIGRRHTLSHEAGHWLNLSHCWGNTNSPGDAANCSSDDGISDTPETIGSNLVCNLNATTCGSLDNVQNIMEYSYCSTMFTQGQVGFMHTALNSNTAGRNNLWTASNLAATGTNTPNVTICEVDFSSTNTVICAGSTVDFSDLSYFGVTSRSWTFDGGTPLNSTDSTTTIVYDTPGVYAVSLQISDGVNTTSETQTNYITVMPNPGVALPYTEGFESITFPDNYNFFVENDDAGNTWSVTSTAASTGAKSLKLNNYNVTAGTEDRFVSGPIDLSVVDPSDDFLLTFKYAYNKKTSADDEWLRVYVSKDCGETWSLRKNIHGDALSEDVTPSAYTPSLESEWQTVSITNITSSYFVENFRYKIQFDGEGGNNIYIDDINLYPTSWLGVNDLNIETELNVYPNPTNDLVNVNFISPISQNVTIELYNAVGQKVNTIFSGNVEGGSNDFSTSIANLANGIYYVKISSDSVTKTVKLTKQ